ncbi:sodium/hydrogen exchanger 3 isoform X2 [Planococcus citri]|uniref:sodium/hydrogen exchanger 3 isoform X2 n=1 Tax=Planococcus citri TaxID=170843 RepID=UPI0031F82995
MKISFVLHWKRNISKECQSLKYFFRILPNWFCQLRLSSGLLIIILFHMLEVVSAEKNIRYQNEAEGIAYSKEYDNSVENMPTLEEDMYHKEKPTNSVKRFKIADIEFQRVETPVLIAMWIFCASLAKICFHMAPDLNQKVPESCLLIVVGVLIGLVLMCIKNIHITALTPDTFFLYMLPPIILDAGYFMPNRLFFDNLGTILLFAVVGTVFNTLTIGASLWLANTLGLFAVDTPVLELFLFSALISAVDPVAVLAVFEEIHVNEILYIVVFGESLLNDAVTVVLYHMFEAFNRIGTANILYTDLLSSAVSFLVVAIGGTFIGIVWGFLTGFVTRFTHQARVIEPILILVMAYIAYLNAEMFHMSGILAITFCGITMKNYVEANISHKSHTTVKYTMKMLSSSSETIIFMFLGVSTVSEHHQWNTAFVIITIFFCTFYRFVGVMLLSAILNHFRLYKLNTVDKFVMAYGGLRGAVAFALALLINPHHVKQREMFITTTIAVIYFTVFIQGITIRPLVKILNVKKAEKRKPTMNERIHERFMDHMMAGIEDILGHHGNHHLRDRFKRFDNKFIRPHLLKNHQGAEPKILETYSKLAMKDALDFMRRNASTLGNISNTESVSAIFRNYTGGNLQASCSQLDNSMWNVDLQELEYNPSKKDLTDARIHHLLTTELCQPPKKASEVPQHRRLSYSRHIVDEKELSQVNYRANVTTRRIVGGSELGRRHHHKRSKKLNKDGKINHVTFPTPQRNGPAKQFSDEYPEELEDNKEFYDDNKNACNDDWDAGITFTVNPATCNQTESSLESDEKKTNFKLVEFNIPSKIENTKHCTPTVAEISLPWHRSGTKNGCEEPVQVTSVAVENKLPWSHSEEESDLESGTVKQREFPCWTTNREYLPYSSPSNTLISGVEKPKLTSVLNLFRRDRSRSSVTRLESNDSIYHPSSSSSAVLHEECGTANTSVSYLSPHRDNSTPLRRGSMMELSSSAYRIPEEDFLSVTIPGSGGIHRIRSGSMCIPRKKDGILTISKSSSSSGSSSSNEDEPFG